MSIIQITDLTFAYDGSYDNIFDGVSIRFDSDWKLGLVGRNGRGKTTLLRLLSGGLEYRGSISSSVSFNYFPYEIEDKTALTLDILMSAAPDAAEWEIRRELSLLDADEEILWRPFDTLSGGEQVKAMLSVLFLTENHFPLIDEPTSHLDEAARAAVGRWLRCKKGFLLVSHDRALLDSCVDHILAIEKTNIEVRGGNFSDWYQAKLVRDQAETERNAVLKKEITRLSEAAKEKAAWSERAESSKIGGHSFDRGYIGHKAAKMMKRAGAIERRTEACIAEKSALLKNIEETEALKLSPLTYHSERLAELRDVSLSYGGTTVCSGVSFTLNTGDRIALHGKNGCGKSSLLRLFHAEQDSAVPTLSGEFYLAQGLKISFVSQNTASLSGSLSDYEKAYRVDSALLRAILRKLGFSRIQFEKDLRDYSEGQKKKLLLARSLCESAHLYIWDEPLNFIDVFSRMQIEELLCAFRPTMIFVEHDSAFREKIATKTVFL